MVKESVLGALFGVSVAALKVCIGVFTPLYLDCLNPLHTQIYNTSEITKANYTRVNITIDDVPVDNSTTPIWQRIDPFFGIWMSMGFDTLLFGTLLLVLYLFVPGAITEREKKYPKRIFVLSGACQAVSALTYQFSTSGTRTAPYLQGPIGYFLIPLTFVLRFLILRKRPTFRKLLCAVVVLLGEFVCLLPTMFPSLESAATRREEGGATGAARILWPFMTVFSFLTHALWNILLEKGAKHKSESDEDLDLKRLNIVYVMFWNFFGTFSTTILFFWIDLIPGFGLMPNIEYFLPQVWFNLRCIFGATNVCGWYQVFTAWGRIISKTSLFFLAALLVRYGEGANLYAILVAVSSPTIFIVFALFDEQALRWNPHFTLSTWLTVGSLVVMLPTVIIYNTGAPEINLVQEKLDQTQHGGDRQTLLADDSVSADDSDHTEIGILGFETRGSLNGSVTHDDY